MADQLSEVGTVFRGQLAVVAQGASEDARYNAMHGVIADGGWAIIAKQAVDVVVKVAAVGAFGCTAGCLSQATGGARSDTGAGFNAALPPLASSTHSLPS